MVNFDFEINEKYQLKEIFANLYKVFSVSIVIAMPP
jgi:hypothetical protein